MWAPQSLLEPDALLDFFEGQKYRRWKHEIVGLIYY